MKNTILKISLLFIVCVALLSAGGAVFAEDFNVQTNSATEVKNNQVILNGYVIGGAPYSSSVWFEWGATTSYENQTQHLSLYAANAPFSQAVLGLSPNTSYHFRAVFQGRGTILYGQDMTFTTSGEGYVGSSSLSVTKRVINLTSGSSSWQSSVSARPSDMLSFAIILQANGRDFHEVNVRDVLPSNLIYKGNMTVNGSLVFSGNSMPSVGIGTILSGQVAIVSYQAQIAPAVSFAYGITTINNGATVTSAQAGTQTALASVTVNKSLVSGASIIATGLTNNFLTESFFLPLLIIVLGLWFGFSGQAILWADKLKARIKR